MFANIIYANSVFFLAMGLLSPFLIIYIQNIAGIESFGIAIGLMVISASLSSYVSGAFSDTIGRKKIIVAAAFSMSLIVLLYIAIQNVWQLFLLQIIHGIVAGTHHTTGTSLLGDLTKEHNRGSKIGLYNAITGVITGFSSMVGGFITSRLGVNTFFIMVAILIFLSAILFLRLPNLNIKSCEKKKFLI